MNGYDMNTDRATFEKPIAYAPPDALYNAPAAVAQILVEATIMTGKELIAKLAVMPRFWVLLIAALTGVYFYVRGEITADVLAGMITALALLVVGAVTIENKVKADNDAKIQMNRDTNEAHVRMASLGVK